MKYTGESLREVNFPLGGIGTGSIGLTGNGRLFDWEILNSPKKGSINGYSMTVIKCQRENGEILVRALMGDVQKELMGTYLKEKYSGFGFGPDIGSMQGFPHFRGCEFTGEYPIAKIRFFDEDFPLEITLTAFNPLIPGDDKNSSIPSAFFSYELKNKTEENLTVTVAFSACNLYKQCIHTLRKDGDITCVKMTHVCESDSPDFADMTLATDAKNAFGQAYWYRGLWMDGLTTFWRELSLEEDLPPRIYDTPEDDRNDHACLCAKTDIAPLCTENMRFVYSWNAPNNYDRSDIIKDENGKIKCFKNYYATIFEDSLASAKYSLSNFTEFYEKTEKFVRSIFDSTLDEYVKDAAASNLSVLKSPTVIRLTDGSFYGWEGVNEEGGSCEGTCTHVWNYVYSLCFLFPQLERSIRDLEYKHSVDENGRMCFRFRINTELGMRDGFYCCVDGQMGSIIKTYREWKISGDDAWLRSHIADVEKVLEYAYNENNTYEWDRDRDGVLEGRQHHTLDMELFGPSSWLEGFYLAALRAAEEMEEYLGNSEKAKEYRELFEKGYAWTKENLFNGKYFIHKVDIKDKSIVDHFDCAEMYWNDERKEIKYQIADGSSIDQLTAQWHANICGLGDIFDPEQRKTAARELYKNNYKASLRDVTNMWRLFAINDESATVICDYPEGVYKPIIPIPYCEEAMTGFEYQAAGLLIGEGMIEEGLRMVRSVRERHDGKKRNPYNEFECGSNYARSMASFALIPILSGFRFDVPHKFIGFSPVKDENNFRAPFYLGENWGIFETKENKATLEMKSGILSLDRIKLGMAKKIVSAKADGVSVEISECGEFEKTVNVKDSLIIEYK